MDKNTLSNYGWIVIAVLVLAVMIALATPFGKYIESGVKSTTAGLFDTSEKAMNIVGMSAGEGEFDEGYNAPNGDDSPTSTPTYGTNDPLLNHNGTIPTGGIYRLANGEKITEGKEFPLTPQPLDAYQYGDFTYVYSAGNADMPYSQTSINNQYYDAGYNGWLVTIANIDNPSATNKKPTYDIILESICGKNVTNINSTFGSNNELSSTNTIVVLPKTINDTSFFFFATGKIQKYEYKGTTAEFISMAILDNFDAGLEGTSIEVTCSDGVVETFCTLRCTEVCHKDIGTFTVSPGRVCPDCGSTEMMCTDFGFRVR